MKKKKQHDDSFAIPRQFGGQLRARDGYIDGPVVTLLGIVIAYTQENYTRLDFVWNNRLHVRTIDRRFSKRGLVTKAAQFAKEVAGIGR